MISFGLHVLSSSATICQLIACLNLFSG
jgi:hypothetical protein